MVGSNKWLESLFMLALVPSLLIRFIVFAPFGYYWAHATTHWKVINDHVQLHNGFYPIAIASGEKIASKWGTFAFYWNFAAWIPTFWFPPPLNLPFTIIDTVITIYLSLATHYQTGYAPHSKKSCNGAAFDWYKPPGANESFFQATARLNGTVTTPVRMCRSFVEEWQYGIVLSLFYALLSLINIIAFVGSLRDAKRRGESFRVTALAMFKVLLNIVVNIPKYLLILLAGILWLLPEYFFRCLPLRFKSKVRFGRRYALKSGLGIEQKAELEVNELKNVYQDSKRSKDRYNGGSGTPTPLSEFLDIYDMLMVVTEELHYSDILNLSLVSKSVRHAVLPTEHFEQRRAAFQRYTCGGEESGKCWLCRKQICIGCRQMPLVSRATLTHHLYNCRPYCTSCYHTHIVTWGPARGQRLKPPQCKCAPVTAHPNIISRYFNGANYYASKQNHLSKVPRAVCRECNLHTADELLELREKKMKVELLEGRMENGEKWTVCARIGCGKTLGTGPRWWICGNLGCQKECRSMAHKAMGRAVGKDETVVGEEAV